MMFGSNGCHVFNGGSGHLPEIISFGDVYSLYYHDEGSSKHLQALVEQFSWQIICDWTSEPASGFASSALFMEAVAPYALALGTCGGPLGIAAGVTLELGAAVADWIVGSELGHDLSDLLGGLFSQAAGIPVPKIDPIVLDLNNSGFAERSGWIKGDDGLLVLDRDRNGEINGGKVR